MFFSIYQALTYLAPHFLSSGLGIARVALNSSGNVNQNIVWNVTALLFWAFLRGENLSFPLRLYHNRLLENRNWLAEMGLLDSLTSVPELSCLGIYLEDCIFDLFDRAWLSQVYRKKEDMAASQSVASQSRQ